MTLGNKTLDDLLGPISKQLGHAGVAEDVQLPEWEFEAKRQTDGLSPDQLTDMFEEEAGKIRVEVKRCAKDALASCLAEIVGKGAPEGGQTCSVVCADDPRFKVADVYDTLEDLPKVSSLCVWDKDNSQASIDAAYNATYGITFATGGIAETGTVVQPCSPTCGRAVSLLPLVHIAVVEASTIVPTMKEVMADLDAQGELASQVCFISGPSATADIELVRVEGVHGPMYVNYVIVE